MFTFELFICVYTFVYRLNSKEDKSVSEIPFLKKVFTNIPIVSSLLVPISSTSKIKPQ